MRSAIGKGPGTDRWTYWSLTAGLVLSTALAVIAGEVPGAPPEVTLAVRPESPRAAYVLFIRERTRDAAELRAYSPKAAASLDGHPVTKLAVYGRQEVLEGPQAEGVAIVRFPSFAEAKAWYDSPAYRAAREHRLKGADYRAILVEGR
jgi:uncharacterized protein (DUF1330 family)